MVQQLIGFPLYLLSHITGPSHYPTLTSHFNRESRVTGDAALTTSFSALCPVHASSACRCHNFRYRSTADSMAMIDVYGKMDVALFYGVPCLLVSHWVTMVVYLQHTDPLLPHYRKPQWIYCRGALSTIDIDFLGWQGRFFLHDISAQPSCLHKMIIPLDRSFSYYTPSVPEDAIL